MNKVMKRILKIVGIAIAVIVVVLIGYIILLFMHTRIYNPHKW